MVEDTEENNNLIETKKEFNWTDLPVIGMVLLNAEKDSYGESIKPYSYYEVGKHKKNGMLAIIPTGRDMKGDFVNDIMKANGKFN